MKKKSTCSFQEWPLRQEHLCFALAQPQVLSPDFVFTEDPMAPLISTHFCVLGTHWCIRTCWSTFHPESLCRVEAQEIPTGKWEEVGWSLYFHFAPCSTQTLIPYFCHLPSAIFFQEKTVRSPCQAWLYCLKEKLRKSSGTLRPLHLATAPCYFLLASIQCRKNLVLGSGPLQQFYWGVPKLGTVW